MNTHYLLYWIEGAKLLGTRNWSYFFALSEGFVFFDFSSQQLTPVIGGSTKLRNNKLPFNVRRMAVALNHVIIDCFLTYVLWW